MHEHSITERLFQLTLEQADLEEGEWIQRLHIELDPNSGYAPDAIRFYFEHLAEGSAASGAELVFRAASDAREVPLQQIRLLAIDLGTNDNLVSANESAKTSESQPAIVDASVCWDITIIGVTNHDEFCQFVCLLAEEHDVSGWVGRTVLDTRMEIEGAVRKLEHFCHHLQSDASSTSTDVQLKIMAAASKQAATVDDKRFF